MSVHEISGSEAELKLATYTNTLNNKRVALMMQSPGVSPALNNSSVKSTIGSPVPHKPVDAEASSEAEATLKANSSSEELVSPILITKPSPYAPIHYPSTPHVPPISPVVCTPESPQLVSQIVRPTSNISSSKTYPVESITDVSSHEPHLSATREPHLSATREPHLSATREPHLSATREPHLSATRNSSTSSSSVNFSIPAVPSSSMSLSSTFPAAFSSSKGSLQRQSATRNLLPNSVENKSSSSAILAAKVITPLNSSNLTKPGSRSAICISEDMFPQQLRLSGPQNLNVTIDIPSPSIEASDVCKSPHKSDGPSPPLNATVDIPSNIDIPGNISAELQSIPPSPMELGGPSTNALNSTFVASSGNARNRQPSSGASRHLNFASPQPMEDQSSGTGCQKPMPPPPPAANSTFCVEGNEKLYLMSYFNPLLPEFFFHSFSGHSPR